MGSMMRCLRLLAGSVVIAVIVLFGSCGKDSSPSGPDDGGNGGGAVRVLETKTSRIDSQGGTVALPGGTQVVFPAGSLGAAADVKLDTIDPKAYFEGDVSGKTIVRCEGITGELASPAELRVPLPSGMTEADSSLVFAGTIDEATGAVDMEPCTVRMIDGKPVAVITATHFSSRLVDWLTAEVDPPLKYGPLEIPYYNQGSSQYCWAVSTHMVAGAARFNKDKEIAEIVGNMGVDEGGITAFSFRTSSALASLVSARTGLKPDRSTWGYLSINKMKDYMKREIGVNRRPVALFNGVWSHAVVVVGYDNDTFYINDPASVNASSVGYTAKTWNEIAGGMSMVYNMVTLVVPTTSLDSSRPHVTINVMPDALSFIKPPTQADPKSSIYVYKWDYETKSGYSFRHLTSGEKLIVIPGPVTQFKRRGDIEITNSSRTSSANVTFKMDIESIDPKITSYSFEEQVTVGPNTTVQAPVPDINVDEFRWNASKTMNYVLTVSALVGGNIVDRQTINFMIASVTPKIDLIAPDRGGRNASVTVKGEGFGSLTKNSRLTFNNTVINIEDDNWKDNEITFTIPSNAETGTAMIRVKRGDVESNAYPFVVTDIMTLQGTVERTVSYWANKDASMEASWTLTGAGLTSEYEDTEYGWWFKAQSGTPVTLNVDVRAYTRFATYTDYYTTRDGKERYVEYSYSNISLAPMPTGPDEPDDPFDVIRISGSDFLYTLSGSGSNYNIDLTFNNLMSWQGMHLIIWLTYVELAKTYEITESGPVFIEEKESPDQRFWLCSFDVQINQSQF